MIITCPECHTRYKVDPASFGPKGRRVRCTNCDNMWTQGPSEEVAETVDPEAPLGAEPAGATEEAAPEPAGAEPQAGAAETHPAPAPEPIPEAAVPRAESEPLQEAAPKPELPSVAAAGPNRRQPEGRGAAAEKRGKVLGWIALITVTAAVLVGGALTRDSIVRVWPPAERIYQAAGFPPQGAAAGLKIEVVSHNHSVEDDRTILVVKGKVTNTSSRVREVPKLQAWIRGEDSRELANWTFTAAQTRLLPGETASFVTRYQNPPPGGTGLAIDFSQEGN